MGNFSSKWSGIYSRIPIQFFFLCFSIILNTLIHFAIIIHAEFNAANVTKMIGYCSWRKIIKQHPIRGWLFHSKIKLSERGYRLSYTHNEICLLKQYPWNETNPQPYFNCSSVVDNKITETQDRRFFGCRIGFIINSI